MTQPNNSQRLWMYEQMLTSRYMEESIERIYMEGKTPVFNMAKGPIPGEMHLSNGQEPCAVGVCAHLEAADIVTATHRPHHIAVAKGVDLNEMMAEIFGKATGLSGGRGGHMHLFDGRVNFSCSGIIAEGMGPAVGAALSRQMQGKPGVAVSFIGEGAANQGAFHETLNLAALWKLPVVFVIEDNAWGISVAKASATCIAQHHVRAAAYGMPGVFVENNDPDGVFRAAGEAIERARAGGGPTLIEIESPADLSGEVFGPVIHVLRYAAGQLEDDRTAARLPARVMSEAQAHDIEARARGRIDEAVQFARESPYPRPEEALEHVFV